MVYLQGRLEVVVHEARNLPNLDHSKRHPDDVSDPYVVIKIIDSKHQETRLGKTHTIDDCLNPKWCYSLSAEINQDVSEIRFDVKDEDRFKSDFIGSCSIPEYAFSNSTDSERTLTILNKTGDRAGKLVVKIRFSGNAGMIEKPQTSLLSKAKGCVSRKRDSIQKKRQGKESSFLHGRMLITIDSAEDLPNLDMTFLNNRNKSDPFATASLVDAEGQAWKVATTQCIRDDLDPVWGETFCINVCHEITSIVFDVYDQDILRQEKMAGLTIPIDSFITSNFLSGKFDLTNKKKKCGKLNLTIRYENKDAHSFEVPNCVYPMRTKCKVKLYQDAHCPQLPLPVMDSTGSLAILQNTWFDVQNTLKNAEKFILITGWSVKTSITLVRARGSEECETLGQILFRKAQQGVDVRLLLWDEITSTGTNPTGAMSTWDNETKNYFKNSQVKVCLALRNKKTAGMRPDDKYFTKCCYSHHQKTIIADMRSKTTSSDNQRQLVAYVGGLDLTSGRYDTPNHQLFSTIPHEHKNDFSNNLLSTSARSGPREPWHDIHSQVTGPAAQDILNNFTERWTKQGIPGDQILNFDDIALEPNEEDEHSWNVQVFRSITEDSVPFHSEDNSNLITKQGKKIDNSLHRAYIHQIQRAKRFIYLENQYFMGSSHFWEDCRDTPVKNLVPLEIATKIIEKIKLREHFVSYIVIPMFPEGNPADIVTQEMLHWQFHTIEMMYSMIGEALANEGIDAEPQDYLMFFCLGKREGPESVPEILKPPFEECAALAFKNRRSMIYVHSKMAIFDDEYIIVGSANINDRSLGGTRDTEIAIGAYQPTASSGEVSTFRRCLWSEHLGEGAPLELDPGSLSCARKVRQLADEALMHYIDVSKPLPKSHLLLYPLQVDKRGTVISRSDCEVFPDTRARVVGTRSKYLPSELTT